jgi:hypothetical protein
MKKFTTEGHGGSQRYAHRVVEGKEQEFEVKNS